MDAKEAIKVLVELRSSIIERATENLNKPVRLGFNDVLKNLSTEKVKGYSINLDTRKTTVAFRRSYANSKFCELVGLSNVEWLKVQDHCEKEKLQQELNLWITGTLKLHKEELL